MQQLGSVREGSSKLFLFLKKQENYIDRKYKIIDDIVLDDWPFRLDGLPQTT